MSETADGSGLDVGKAPLSRRPALIQGSRPRARRAVKPRKIIVFTEVPSNNKLLRMHWAQRRRLKAVFVTEIWATLVNTFAFPIKRKKVKKHVSIILYRKGRRYDKDNAYGGCKLVIDSLRELNLIYQDSKKWLDLEVDQELDHWNPRTEIEIE